MWVEFDEASPATGFLAEKTAAIDDVTARNLRVEGVKTVGKRDVGLALEREKRWDRHLKSLVVDLRPSGQARRPDRLAIGLAETIGDGHACPLLLEEVVAPVRQQSGFELGDPTGLWVRSGVDGACQHDHALLNCGQIICLGNGDCQSHACAPYFVLPSERISPRRDADALTLLCVFYGGEARLGDAGDRLPGSRL